jgi:hypothetical protein
MSKFIVNYLEENYGMTVYESKEEFVEGFGGMFDLDSFDELLEEMKGVYEVIEITDDCEIRFIVEE